jgi:PAS domain S-box-containing protein
VVAAIKTKVLVRMLMPCSGYPVVYHASLIYWPCWDSVYLDMLKARILVVEDEAVVAAAIAKCLQGLGHEVPAVVASGEEAVRRAVSLDPDLVLMDIRLKGPIDGIEASRRISQRLKTPIIFLTAYSDDETLLRARVTEPYGYILKPFDEKTLKAAIEMTLYRSAIQAKERRTRRRLTAILDGIMEGVIMADIKGEIDYINQPAERLTGYAKQEAAGLVLGQVFHLLDEQGSQRLIPVSRVLMDGETVEVKGCILQTKAEESFPIDLHMEPIRNEAGNTTGVILSFHESLL